MKDVSDNPISHIDRGLNSVALTIIIPVWNGEDCIGKCLEAISQQSEPGFGIQLIVVDNGSTDRTAEIVERFPFAELMHEPKPGSYRARNLGLSRAEGKFVLFTDGDCIPDENWVRNAQLLTKIVRPSEIVAGQIKLFREPGAGKVVSTFEELTAFNQEGNVQYGFCVTANWFCHTETIRNAGGFNNDLLSGGDLELSQRLSAAGCTFQYRPELLVHHPTRASLSGMIRKRRRITGGKWILARQKSESILHQMHKILSDAITQARWMIKKPNSLKIKLGLIGLITAMTVTSQLELIRLSVGFAPYRD